MDKSHDIKARRYSKKISFKTKFYYFLFAGFLFSLLNLLIDLLFSRFDLIRILIKDILIILLFFISLFLYSRWEKRNHQPIITIQSKDYKEPIVASGKGRIRIGSLSIFSELPLVEIASKMSPGLPSASICRTKISL